MSIPRTPTTGELRAAEMAVALVERRIRERMERCTYVEHGPRAYENAERAIAAAFKDVRGYFHRIRNESNKESS